MLEKSGVGMVKKVQGLSRFLRLDGLPQDEDMKIRILRSDSVKRVICFCLGPEGTNIAQAARKWLHRMGIDQKSEVRLYPTPEACLEEARKVKEDGVLAVFWTCAVYAHESQFFFTNPDILPFYFQEVMDLDSMQLATRGELLAELNTTILAGVGDERFELPRDWPEWTIASHPSPKFLVKPIAKDDQIILVNSNAAAAEQCAKGLIDVCITTEEARKIHNLVTLHVFGSPPMVFFGGLTPHGSQIIKSASLLS